FLSFGSAPNISSRPSLNPSPSVSASGSAGTRMLFPTDDAGSDVPAEFVAISVKVPPAPEATVIVNVAAVPPALITDEPIVIDPDGLNENVEPNRFAPATVMSFPVSAGN